MTLVVQDNVIWQGREYFPGEVIPGLTEEDKAQLTERGLLGNGEPVVAETPEVEKAAAPDAEDLSGLNKAQLAALAAERGIEYDSKATKADLVGLLEAPAEVEGA